MKNKITLLEKVIFSLPEFFSSIFNSFFSAHLLKFYLETVKFSNTKFALVGSIIGSLDLFIDLFIGHSIDLFGPRFLLITGAPIVTLSSIFLFSPPGVKNETLLFLYVLVLTFLKNIYPLNSSYATMLSRIKRIETKEDENFNLFAVKHIFSLLGGVFGYFIPAFMDVSPFMYILVIGLFSISSYLLMAFVSFSFDLKSMETTDVKKIQLIPGIKKSFKNKAFLSLLSLFIFESFRGLFWSGLYMLYMTQVIGLKGKDYDFWMGIFHIIGMSSATLFTPLWMKLDRKFGSKTTWIFSYVLQVPVGVFVYLFCTTPQVYLIFFIFLQITGSSSGFLLDSIKSRVFDYDELLTNQRREGSIEACLRFFPRYISLPGSVISFWIINYFGYQPDINQSETVVNVIAILTALLPSLTSLVCLYIMYTFPITDEIHKKILESREKKLDVDPLTGEKIFKSKLKSEDEDTLNHFFAFEIKYYQNNGFKNLEFYFFVFWFSLAVASISYFVNQNISIIGFDLWKTFILWISSILFTMSMFHYNRVSAFDRMTKINLKDIQEYLQQE
jgi:glycoside/pentoside/hexuronide:cation symporter, GPH family